MAATGNSDGRSRVGTQSTPAAVNCNSRSLRISGISSDRNSFDVSWDTPKSTSLTLDLIQPKTGGNGALGAELWFAARIVYLPLYVLGVPWLRSIVYGVSLAGLVLMLVRLL